MYGSRKYVFFFVSNGTVTMWLIRCIVNYWQLVFYISVHVLSILLNLIESSVTFTNSVRCSRILGNTRIWINVIIYLEAGEVPEHSLAVNPTFHHLTEELKNHNRNWLCLSFT